MGLAADPVVPAKMRLGTDPASPRLVVVGDLGATGRDGEDQPTPTQDDEEVRVGCQVDC